MWPLPNYRIIKCFLNVYDVPENGGETAIVPGSFRLQTGPSQTLAGEFTASTADRAKGGSRPIETARKFAERRPRPLATW